MVNLSRKKPVEHEVGAHIRLGKRVEKYRRGSGKGVVLRKKKVVGRARKSIGSGEPGEYLVILRYDRIPNEKFRFGGLSFQNAQRNGFEMSDNNIHPRRVSVRFVK